MARHLSYRYGHDWNTRMLQPIREMSEAAARKAFEAKPQVSVSKVEEGGVPEYTLILGTGGQHVRVRKYDSQGSVVESYDYSSVEGDDRLFLNNYSTWVYADDARGPQGFMDSKAIKAWVFRQDGTATCRETVDGIEEARITEYRDLDVSGHWRPRPQWGDWDSFGLHPEPGAAS